MGGRKFRFKLPAHTHYGDSSLGNGWEAEGGKFLQWSEDMVFRKAARADTCTNIVRDVVMTTANLPPVQWRQQNLTLSLSHDGSASGALW